MGGTIVMCILRCTSVTAPLVLNANTLRVCSFIFGAHHMQAYCALRAIVMCILRCTSVAAPLVLNVNTLRVCSFTLLPVRCKHQGQKSKINTPTSEGVCVGRSYRNRTYTVGVRGPSATTTPSSIAWIIIYHKGLFCNRFFMSQQKNNGTNDIFWDNWLVFVAKIAKLMYIAKAVKNWLRIY